MLELKNIVKVYPAGDGSVTALKGVSLRFRKSEFVSILGPSGCGKTTMLNIIGGLDQYTEGDLVINGVSTKNYKDRDWDSYRNHSIGFVFQSYNLIPHQSVLQNVELALTVSGVSKAERRKRATEALNAVGLSTQLKKKPAEMSGGQMQRVAIARALVNNPDIILADEPTGALDTETSIQIMEILKEVSKDHLVIMVTHNPDLANTYSTRIIRMLDGEITGDTQPVCDEEMVAAPEENTKGRKVKLPTMSFFTAFMLSLKNLFTKKGRTILTSFAGSIGIIGIALIYAVSNGMTTFINQMQEDTLSSYPLTIEAAHADLNDLVKMFAGSAESKEKHERDAVYQKMALYNLANAMNNLQVTENDLKSFKTYLDNRISDKEDKLSQALTGIQYSYDLDIQAYTKNAIDGTVMKSDTAELLKTMFGQFWGVDTSSMGGSGSGIMSMMSSSGNSNLWEELLEGLDGSPVNDILFQQYDLIYGSWPSEYNEVVLVLDKNNELDDMTLYALGLKSKDEIMKTISAAFRKEELSVEAASWSYEDICNREFRIVIPSECYTRDEKTGLWIDISQTDAGMRYLYNNGIPVKISGIIRPNEDAVARMIKGSVGYTAKLTRYVVEKSENSEVIKAQKENPGKDIITGMYFRDTTGTMTDKDKADYFDRYVEALSDDEKKALYIDIASMPDAALVEATAEQYLANMTREMMEKTLVEATQKEMGMDVSEYFTSMSDEEIREMFRSIMVQQISEQMRTMAKGQLEALPAEQLLGMFSAALSGYTEAQKTLYYDEVLVFSDSDYENNLKLIGSVDLSNPSAINIFASSFANKDTIEDCINEYNKSVDEYSRISYTDYVGIMMSSITTIIDAISYILIAFVSISLVVSSIMIGVITLISVQERTKEIGILRSIGASKKDVSSMFNAETLIIGFTSGLIGVLMTYILCLPINAIIHSLTNINNLNAALPVSVALILIGISMLLTLIAGIIPSRSAAKKDPVVALRTE